MKLLSAPTLDKLLLATRLDSKLAKLEGRILEGYRNADDTAGAKDVLDVMISV